MSDQLSDPITHIRPDWPAPNHVQALFTTRHGGCSPSPYDSFNLGDHVDDDAAHVQRNREIHRSLMDGTPTVYYQQVHGTGINRLTDDVVREGVDSAAPVEADACVTTQSGLACTMMVADCLPVLFTNRDGTAVAVAHAGWRGLADGVLARALGEMVHLTRVPVDQLLVWLGPCIGPTSFEVGTDVRTAFTRLHEEDAIAFEPVASKAEALGAHAADKYLANLPLLARHRLQRLGVEEANMFGNDGSDAWCTVLNESLYFSHRRDAKRFGNTGRMAASIWMQP